MENKPNVQTELILTLINLQDFIRVTLSWRKMDVQYFILL